jgi:hypothetical protein
MKTDQDYWAAFAVGVMSAHAGEDSLFYSYEADKMLTEFRKRFPAHDHQENAGKCVELLQHLLTGWDTGCPQAFGDLTEYTTSEAQDVAKVVEWLKSL